MPFLNRVSLFRRHIPREKGAGLSYIIQSHEMHLTRSTLYAFRLSLQQNASTPAYRSGGVDRKTVRSALLLATAGLSLSTFSLKQMLSSPAQHRRFRRIN